MRVLSAICFPLPTFPLRERMRPTRSATGAAAALPILPVGWYGTKKTAKSGFFEGEFGITDELCRKVLAQAMSRGGDFADLFFEHTISNWVILEDGKVNRAYSDVEVGVGIRTVRGAQVGYGFTQELTETSMMNAASTAASIADASSTKIAGRFEPLRMKDYYPLKKLLIGHP